MQQNQTPLYQPFSLSQLTQQQGELSSTDNSQSAWLTNTNTLNPGLLYLPLTAAITGWLLLFFILHLNLWKLLRQRMTSIQKKQESACYQCQFFSHNPYMKCAVNPSHVLKEEANNCADYSPKKQQE